MVVDIYDMTQHTWTTCSGKWSDLHIFCGGETMAVKELVTPELEQVVRVENGEYQVLFKAEDE